VNSAVGHAGCSEIAGAVALRVAGGRLRLDVSLPRRSYLFM
jgi:hypothetical protein